MILAHCLAWQNAQAKFARTREQNDTRVTLLRYFALVCGRLHDHSYLTFVLQRSVSADTEAPTETTWVPGCPCERVLVLGADRLIPVPAGSGPVISVSKSVVWTPHLSRFLAWTITNIAAPYNHATVLVIRSTSRHISLSRGLVCRCAIHGCGAPQWDL